jgi:Winged helix DNA-binding domain
MTETRLDLTREQVLGFRRRVGGLGERWPAGPDSLRRAAWCGLQDSMPRAALLSIHARVEEAGPSAWEDPALVQLWGPRFSVFVVAARDLAVFSLGTLPDDARGRQRAADLAERDAVTAEAQSMPLLPPGGRVAVHWNE